MLLNQNNRTQMKKVVLKDIAQHLGVSTALVSYVLNGLAEEKQVGKEIAEKIRSTAIELNYQPNHIAKSLKTRRTNTIGLVVADYPGDRVGSQKEQVHCYLWQHQ